MWMWGFLKESVTDVFTSDQVRPFVGKNKYIVLACGFLMQICVEDVERQSRKEREKQ